MEADTISTEGKNVDKVINKDAQDEVSKKLEKKITDAKCEAESAKLSAENLKDQCRYLQQEMKNFGS